MVIIFPDRGESPSLPERLFPAGTSLEYVRDHFLFFPLFSMFVNIKARAVFFLFLLFSFRGWRIISTITGDQSK